MSRTKDIEKLTEELLIPIAERQGVSIYDVEYVREAGEWYLRAFIDREGGVDIDKCVDVSRELSDALDEKDFIDEAYTLEVSSPGLGRKLTKDRHLSNSLGQEVEITLYKALPDGKTFTGILKTFDADTITLTADGTDRTFERSAAAVVRLTFDCSDI